MSAAKKKAPAPAQRKKSPAPAKPKKAPRATKGRAKQPSASVLGDEGILIHTDEGYFYLSEDEYKQHQLPDEAVDLAKVLVERGCLVASIPDDVAISGCYCYLVSIANLNKVG